MSLGWIIVIGVLLVILVIGLFSTLTNPQDVDAEEEARAAKESDAKKKKRWWR